MLEMSLENLPSLDCRIPHWEEDALHISDACPICRRPGAPALFQRPDTLAIAYCRECGLWYVCRRPTLESLLTIYDDYWGKHRPVLLDARMAENITTRAPIYAAD